MAKSIFISIVCFKDPDLVKTVRNMFRMAAYPERLTIGIILQEDEENLHIFKDLTKMKNVIMKVFPTSWAGGCGKARAEAQKLYAGQDFFYQSDSHMRFDPGWDKMLEDELGLLPPKSILSTLPPGFDPVTEQRDHPTYNEMVFYYFFRNLPLHVAYSYSLQGPMPDVPKPTPFLAGGVLFAPGSICDMKFDPYFYFHGEEFTMNIRLWTRGYTNYSPRFNFCYHSYRNVHTPRVTLLQHIDPTRDVFLHERSMSRYQHLMGFTKRSKLPAEHLVEIDEYGLGTERSVRSWEETYGIWLKDEAIEHDTERVVKGDVNVTVYAPGWVPPPVETLPPPTEAPTPAPTAAPFRAERPVETERPRASVTPAPVLATPTPTPALTSPPKVISRAYVKDLILPHRPKTGKKRAFIITG